MKRFIITCAALMSAALLYGAVDFMISRNHGDLTRLYREKPNPEKKHSDTIPAPAGVRFNFVNEPRTVSVAVNQEKEKVKNKKTAKREIKLEEYSRAVLTDEEAVAEKEIKNDAGKSTVPDHKDVIKAPSIIASVHQKDAFSSIPVKTHTEKKKRKISFEKFSRAPLRVAKDSAIIVLNDSLK